MLTLRLQELPEKRSVLDVLQRLVLLVLAPEVVGCAGDAADHVLENAFEEDGEKVVELEVLLVLFIVLVVGVVLEKVTTR